MNKLRAFINQLTISKRLRGTKGLSMTMINAMKVVKELDETLTEANAEAQDQADKVRAAQAEMKRIEDLINKGETFLTGLKGLFGMTD